MRIAYVYKITNLINNKVYIGKTVDPKQRWRNHLWYAKDKLNKNKQCKYLHFSIRKHGKLNFTFEIIEICESENLAFERETFWILHYNSINKKFGYNLTLGGKGSIKRKISIEERLRRSNTMKILNLVGYKSKNFGRKHKIESKIKISKSLIGHTVSVETRSKISKSNAVAKNWLYCIPSSFEKKLNIHKNLITNKIEVIDDTKNFNLLRKDYCQGLTDHQKDEIVNLYQNYTMKELATKFNVNFSTIKNIINKWSESKKYKKNLITNKQRWKIISMYLSQDYTIVKISEICNLNNNIVQYTIKHYIKMARKLLNNNTNKQTY